MYRVNVKDLIGFSFLDSIYWAFYACLVAYLSSYLLECGMSNAVLSIMLAVFMGMSFAGAFFWGSRCDKAKTNKKIFIPEFIAAVAVGLSIFFMAKVNLWISTILYPVFGFLSSPLGSNLDAWMLRSFDRDATTYGRARSIGSAGYAVAALLMGQFIKKFGYVTIPVATLITAACVVLMASLMKEKPFEDLHVKNQESVNPMKLFGIKPYLFLIVVLFLIGLSISPINNLKIVILQSVGGDVSNLGIDSFAGVMVQALLIFISGSFKRLPTYFRLFLVAICVLATMVLTFGATSPFMITLGTIFNNVSYGIMLPTMREITETNVTGSLKNTAHSLTDATYGSFAGIIALLYSGKLMDVFGARSVALLGMCIMLIPVLLTLIATIRQAMQKKNA